MDKGAQAPFFNLAFLPLPRYIGRGGKNMKKILYVSLSILALSIHGHCSEIEQKGISARLVPVPELLVPHLPFAHTCNYMGQVYGETQDGDVYRITNEGVSKVGQLPEEEFQHTFGLPSKSTWSLIQGGVYDIDPDLGVVIYRIDATQDFTEQTLRIQSSNKVTQVKLPSFSHMGGSNKEKPVVYQGPFVTSRGIFVAVTIENGYTFAGKILHIMNDQIIETITSPSSNSSFKWVYADPYLVAMDDDPTAIELGATIFSFRGAANLSRSHFKFFNSKSFSSVGKDSRLSFWGFKNHIFTFDTDSSYPAFIEMTEGGSREVVPVGLGEGQKFLAGSWVNQTDFLVVQNFTTKQVFLVQPGAVDANPKDATHGSTSASSTTESAPTESAPTESATLQSSVASTVNLPTEHQAEESGTSRIH